MELQNSTILITGGTHGIGLEYAKQLLILGAKVIVTGRDNEKLTLAKKMFPQIFTYQCDITNKEDLEHLFKEVIESHPDLNIIMNNAGIMRSVEINDASVTLDNITDEIETNFSGTVRMVHLFLPHLMSKKSSAIINITSGLGYIPFTTSPIYCGTKSAVHIYSQALRLQLKNTSVKVFEIAPPKTDKPLQTAVPETSNKGSMKVSDMVQVSIKGVMKNRYEIRPGLSNTMKWMSRIAPNFFTKLINNNLEKAKLKVNKQDNL